MAQSVPFPLAAAGARARAVAGTAAIPWSIWCAVTSVACSLVAGWWDISWHLSIGRDSFWTPPHVLNYFGCVFAGIWSGAVILSTTFGRNATFQKASVSIWGLRGPLGAFLCAWGGIAMLCSAPFDNWWHGAYGLDIKVLSPPHLSLGVGILAVRAGTLLLIVAMMNRSEGMLRAKLEVLIYALLSALLGLNLGLILDPTLRAFMHSARFYLFVALAAPLWMGVTARLMRRGWACTIVAGMFTFWRMLLVWVLPLFPAEPKLAPVYFPVTHFIPPDFPLLVIVPALACDLVGRRLTGRKAWTQAAVLGTLFLAVFLAAQWRFADFLMSPASRNAFFGTHYVPFFISPVSDWARSVYSVVEKTALLFWWRMTLAFAASIVTMRIGFAWGEWMRRLLR